MKKVIILHAWGSNAEKHWYQWLSKELESRGYEVTIPNFPSTDYPVLTEWLKTLDKVIDQDYSSTILVGHSLGSVTILRYLQSLPSKVKIPVAILVAGFCIPNPYVDEGPILNFLEPKWQWPHIRSKAKQWFVINSDNDPYIPLKDAKLLAKNLQQKLILRKGEGHFSASTNSKYKKFPYLLQLFDQLEE